MNARAKKVFERLARFESRNINYVEADGSWPVVWDRARGVVVWDLEGRRYLDLTAAFGVAAAGHANPRVVRAAQRQLARLAHAMGDVHPHRLKADLARELSRLTFERWSRRPARQSGPHRGGKPVAGKAIFCNSGFEAVEAALKTACLATGKRGVIAFAGGYHGLGYGALNTTHREHFRGPFRSQLAEFGEFVPFPLQANAPGHGRSRSMGKGAGADLDRVARRVRRLLSGKKFGAVLVEPIQVRGGIRIPPVEFLPLLRRLCDEAKALLILDEIYTGFGRTGKWFACEESGVMPDLICLGKALTGGYPLSACVGKAALMDAAWPASTGEAIHTSTFLGNPVGCAMALAQIRELRSRRLVRRAARLGSLLGEMLRGLQSPSSEIFLRVRGRGLLAGVEFTNAEGQPAGALVFSLIKQMKDRGYLLLPEGEFSNVLSFTPPLVITERQLERTIRTLQAVLDQTLGVAPAAARAVAKKGHGRKRRL